MPDKKTKTRTRGGGEGREDTVDHGLMTRQVAEGGEKQKPLNDLS